MISQQQDAAHEDLYAQLLWIARTRGHADGWATRAFKDRVGCWPLRKYADVEPRLATPEIVRWCDGRMLERAITRPQEPAPRLEPTRTAGEMAKAGSSLAATVASLDRAANLATTSRESARIWALGREAQRLARRIEALRQEHVPEPAEASPPAAA